MKKIVLMFLALIPLMGMAKGISYIERDGAWYYIYDDNGKRAKTLSASSVGDVKGWSATFFVSESGSWIYIYNEDGKRTKTLSKSSVGNVLAVSGDTFTSRSGNWIYTYDRDGKRLSTRAAR